ncbi:hypothetical protein [Nocardia sp. NBC_01009]|uniref:hypothetical protein n=1 Tax=Nocardia sp. NBC_01009 TaxID=2975996 RepID=UPI0038645568|nr:hypothetical protein OHA42_36085 [Nocardia sp. NBC_01009]
MESSRTKIAGPAIAAGAVSLGLVLIGACGVGKHDTYVAPPPIKSAADAAPMREGSSVTVPKVFIPPSPTWKVAPNAPRRDVAFTVPPTAAPGESTTRPAGTTTLRADTSSLPLPPPVVATEAPEPVTAPPPTTPSAEPTPPLATTPAAEPSGGGE